MGSFLMFHVDQILAEDLQLPFYLLELVADMTLVNPDILLKVMILLYYVRFFWYFSTFPLCLYMPNLTIYINMNFLIDQIV